MFCVHMIHLWNKLRLFFYGLCLFLCVYVHVCACVRVCVRAIVRLCLCVRVCVLPSEFSPSSSSAGLSFLLRALWCACTPKGFRRMDFLLFTREYMSMFSCRTQHRTFTIEQPWKRP